MGAGVAGIGALAAIGGLIQLGLSIWGLILLSRLVSAVERASDAYRESTRAKQQ
jgi:ABC-type protease/lipase transport system fused ATPase/permease subunit